MKFIPQFPIIRILKEKDFYLLKDKSMNQCVIFDCYQTLIYKKNLERITQITLNLA